LDLIDGICIAAEVCLNGITKGYEQFDVNNSDTHVEMLAQ